MANWQTRLRRGAVLVLALSIAAIATMIALGGGLEAVGEAFARVPAWAIAAAIACTLLEWVFDAIRFAVAGRVFDVRAPARAWLAIALANLSAAYIGNVGPAVSGWMLARRGMKPGEALAVSLAKQILFFPVALAPAWIVATLSPSIGGEVRGTLEVMGIACTVGLVLALVLARHPGRVRAWMEKLLRKRGGDFVEQFFAGLRRFFFERPRLLAASTLFAVLNQLAILGTVASLAYGFAARGPVATSSYLFSTLSQVAPTPGGAGVSEAGGALLFRDLLAPSMLVAFLILARFLTIQLPILVGGWLLARELRAR